MTKEEARLSVIGAISMALKDSTLQQGFEIICKENAELKKEVEKHKWNNIFLEDCADYDKKIAEEYTTLQERITKLEQYADLADEKVDEVKRQLTKAKELLKWFVWYFREGSPNLVPYRHKVAEAEQFLKEIES